jgi:hypothetical protein
LCCRCEPGHVGLLLPRARAAKRLSSAHPASLS